MQQNAYLTFSLNGYLYGINSSYVEEVLPLPELILLPEMDGSIVGIFDLRGEILPVLDLSNELGYPKTDYRLSDSLIIARYSELRLGIIIHGFSNIRTISSQEIVKSDTAPMESDPDASPTHLANIIAGMIIDEDKIWILHDLENWISTSQVIGILDAFTQQKKGTKNGNLLLEKSSLEEENKIIFCPTATEAERAIFRNRAESLKTLLQTQEQTELQPIVVFSLGDCFWGIDSDHVREFVDVKKIIPIPCCPIHIIGNTNLRGEVLTIVDIRKSLDIPVLEISVPCKVIVVEIKDAVVGIRVDRIVDATFLLNVQEMILATNVLSDLRNAYLRGTVPYQGNSQQPINVLDLSKLLLKSGLVVDERV
jgi:purine-binding chemotaxis protein CheW